MELQRAKFAFIAIVREYTVKEYVLFGGPGDLSVLVLVQ
jgi:hypothetical protein